MTTVEPAGHGPSAFGPAGLGPEQVRMLALLMGMQLSDQESRELVEPLRSHLEAGERLIDVTDTYQLPSDDPRWFIATGAHDDGRE